jgi:hypothetical protein
LELCQVERDEGCSFGQTPRHGSSWPAVEQDQIDGRQTGAPSLYDRAGDTAAELFKA